MSIDRITALVEKLMSGTCTWQEKKELFALIESVDDPQLKSVLEKAWERYELPSHNLSPTSSSVILHNILHQNESSKVYVLRRWRIGAIAAAGLLLIGLSIYQWRSSTPDKVVIVAATDIKAPASHKAIITLSDGRQIPADSLAGELALQGKTKVVRLANGKIVYQPQGNENSHLMNTLTNPRGSQVTSITLADGTQIWLNAGSSLTYPVAFSGRERKVTITGEAYFEVAHSGDQKIPFFVNIKNHQQRDSSQVLVLGTHFNIKAYDDEADTRVTLLQGSVQVNHEQQGIRITPGQQASYTQGEAIRISTPDTKDVVAWKDGLFAYQSSSIAQVLRDAARWYDIEVVYAGKVPDDTFTGNIPRTATLNELLSILKMSRVNFKLEGRQLTVLN